MHEEAAAQRVGQTIDRYEIEAVLGAGGFGAVFRARHVMMDRQVALKLLHPSAASSDEIRERFIREARTLGKLGHPHIIDIYDCGVTDGGELFLAMQLLDGEDLSERAQRGRVASSEVVSVICQVLDALEAAHNAGIVHRDLKPANVYLAKVRGEEVVKLLDFGISKLESGEGETGLTKTGIIMGTPHYMAPEMFSGVKDVDHRVDLYAVGVMLYELLTGRPPHDAESYEQLIVKIVSSDPPSLRSRAPALPPFLLDVVDRALQRAPAARFTSAAEMRQALIGGAQQAVGFSMQLPAGPGSGGPTGPMPGPSMGSSGSGSVAAPSLGGIGGPALSPPPTGGPLIAKPASTGVDLVGEVPQFGATAAPTPMAVAQPVPTAPRRDPTLKIWVAVGIMAALLIGGIAAAVISSQSDDRPPPLNTPDLSSLVPPSAPPAPSPSPPTSPVAPPSFPDDKPPVTAPEPSPVRPTPTPTPTPMESAMTSATQGGTTSGPSRYRISIGRIVSAAAPSHESLYALFEQRRGAILRCRGDHGERFELTLFFSSRRFTMATNDGAQDESIAECVGSAIRSAGPVDSSGSGIIHVNVALPAG